MPHHQLIGGMGTRARKDSKIANQYSTCGFVDQEQLKHYLQNGER
jgi:hypothetical protein